MCHFPLQVSLMCVCEVGGGGGVRARIRMRWGRKGGEDAGRMNWSRLKNETVIFNDVCRCCYPLQSESDYIQWRVQMLLSTPVRVWSKRRDIDWVPDFSWLPQCAKDITVLFENSHSTQYLSICWSAFLTKVNEIMPQSKHASKRKQ